MSTLESIHIETEPFIDLNDGSGVHALLSEIDTQLERLLTNGEEGIIDLKTIPISHDEYQHLMYVLGEGELSATIHALGRSIVRETAIAGVWWIIHYNEDGAVIADMIEVTSMPAIMKSDRGDMQNSLIELRKRIDNEQPLNV